MTSIGDLQYVVTYDLKVVSYDLKIQNTVLIFWYLKS